MSALTLDELTKIQLPLKAHAVPMPEYGNNGDGKPRVAYVAELSMDEREERITAAWASYKKGANKQDDAGQNAFIAAACLCDDSRNFECEDAMAIARASQALGKLGAPAARLFAKAMEVNSISAEAAEELEKN